MNLNLKQQRAAAYARAKSIIDAAGPTLTATEQRDFDAAVAEVKRLDVELKRAGEQKARADALGALDDPGGVTPGSPGAAGAGRFLALTGHGRKSHARDIAGRMLATSAAVDPLSKALVGAGVVTTDVPMLGVVPLGRVPASLLEVLPLTPRQTPSYRYLRQSGRTNNAAVVAPGGLKPTSPVSVTPIDASLAVVAHLSEALDRYLLGDAEELSRFTSDELLYGLGLALEALVLNGAAGTGIVGLNATSGIQAVPFTASPLVTLRSGITALETAGHEAGVLVLNPTDWEAIETSRNASGQFDLDGPVDRAARRAWGVQVVTANAVPTGTALAIDTNAVGLSTDTAGIEVKWSDSTSDDFSKNQLRARVEGRFQLDVYQPLGVARLDLSAV